MGEPSTYRGVSTVTVMLENHVEEEVDIHPEYGPVLLGLDGRKHVLGQAWGVTTTDHSRRHQGPRAWRTLTNTEQTCLIHVAAKKNCKLRERFGATIDDINFGKFRDLSDASLSAPPLLPTR